jgi:UDP-N-acetylmuramyl pentapeptide phosphotransferase/UDP-N-acetylglucosamine-1-phosphate transferase
MSLIIELIYFSFFVCICSYFIIKIIPLYFKSYFSLCVSNNKTSLYHEPILRGLGIIFPFILILNTTLFETPLNNIDIIIIFLSSFIGFWDDKFEINQKNKFFLFTVIGLMYSLYINLGSDFNVYNFFSNAFVFLFLILFFNQIDGINGLAGLTFLASISFLTILLKDIYFLLPVVCSVIAYLGFNLRGKIGIQGDTGSFFMGSFIAILCLKVFKWYELGLVFFIISPIMIDICSTTTIRMFLGISILKGHKENLYQRLVKKYKNHVVVSVSFVIIQSIFCGFLIYLIKSMDLVDVYLICLLILLLLGTIFLYVSYLIHKRIILN